MVDVYSLRNKNIYLLLILFLLVLTKLEVSSSEINNLESHGLHDGHNDGESQQDTAGHTTESHGKKNDVSPENPHGQHDSHGSETDGSNCKQNPKEDANKLKNYEFFPNSTKIGFAFVGIWVGFILIAKIMYTSSDQYKTTNKFDLVLFKPPTKNSAIGPRRIYSNNNANLQNINAALSSGIDLSVLNVRNSFSQNQNQGQSQTETQQFTNGTPRSSITIGKVEKF